ncbi:helix-turn-helix domain-containing protein [Arthrobacter dokdonensis]|uniref:helix-turn-helix domain-containing protein n=1 Tax=Arthrobacter dokdonellae TaxID=2211210 RepID=UPI001494656A|nr:helix-turn-helix domain-containing protein [Arthrobacter dokdonellae]
MTAQRPLPVAMASGAVKLGLAGELVSDADGGGTVFLHGQASFSWDGGDEAGRRWAAVRLAALMAAGVAEIAAAFDVTPTTVWLWKQLLTEGGIAALVPEKKGPKRASRLTESVIARIVELRSTGLSQQAVGDAVGVSEFSVRRALKIAAEQAAADAAETPTADEAEALEPAQQPGLPLQPVPAPRAAERAAAGLLECAVPVFSPAAHIRHAGLFLAFPALETTGLLSCAKEVYGALPNGFYGLESVLIDAVLRALAGEARAEGATRFDPVELGRVLGLDRAPEVKTIRRRISQLAEAGNAGELIAALAKHHLAGTGPGGENLAAILYVDGHVRAYQGTKKIGKIYSTRLKFPVPATEETWVTDAQGSPVFVVMAKPGASLAAELRGLLPELRTVVGDDRRVLVGFDRGGWSPALFKHMDAAGFDVLTWRKGTTKDIEEKLFTEVSHTDDHGEERKWSVADTIVDLPLATTKKTGEVFSIRQISRIVGTTGGGTRQIHILTTDRDLPAGELVYRMGNRWRQENQFRYARMHFELDSHDSYASTGDDEDRMVPNPAKAKAYQKVVAARNQHAEAAAIADINLMALKTPAEGSNELTITVTSAMHNQVMAPLWEAETALIAAEKAHKKIPAKLRLGDLNPGQQVLDTEVKLIHTGIRMAAYNTAMTIAREIRTNTGYKRANQEAHALMRQMFNQTGDIDTTKPGYLTITLDPLPTKAKTAAAAELCTHLTSTKTRYPGSSLILKYEIKTKAPALIN